jgi:hypothetical protein
MTTDLERMLVDLGAVKEGDLRLKKRQPDESDDDRRGGNENEDEDDDWD